MKKLFALMAVLVLSVSMALAVAPTGVSLSKTAVVTGDWEWSGSSWTKPIPSPVTASLSAYAVSPAGTFVGYSSSESLGEAWKYSLSSDMYMNAPGTTSNQLGVITVNPPDTTPGTDWTKFGYNEINMGMGFSQTNLYTNGYGSANINTHMVANSPFDQHLGVCINC